MPREDNMHPKEAYRQYQSTYINTSSPEELICLLFKEALRNMLGAKEALLKGESLVKRKCLVKAFEVISELMNSLNLEKGGAIGEQLAILYEYVMMKLLEANVADKPKPLDEATAIIATLNDGWDQICLSATKDENGVPVVAER